MKKQMLKYLQSFPTLVRYLLVGLPILIISWMFPQQVQFEYHFQEGKVWRHPDLVAAFDFPIKKPAEEYESEMRKTSSLLVPYYQLDTSVMRQQQAELIDNFRAKQELTLMDARYEDVHKRPEVYLAYGRQILEQLYGRGILKLDERHRELLSSSFINVLYERRTASRRLLRNLHDEARAEMVWNDSMSAGALKEADFLDDIMQEAIEPNLFYNDSLTTIFNQDRLDAVPRYRGRFKQDSVIIRHDDIITSEKYQLLASYKEYFEATVSKERDGRLIFIGYVVLVAIVMTLLVVYLRQHHRDIWLSNAKLSFIMLWIVSYSVLVNRLELSGFANMYVIPFAIVPIVMKNFYSDRLALFVHLIIVLITSLLSSQSYQFAFTEIIVGIVVVVSDFKTRNWSRFFLSMLYVFLTYAMLFGSLTAIQSGSLSAETLRGATPLLLNILLTLLAYPFIPLLERIFGFTSEITLVELSALDNPLLKELSIKAPGTLQHSLQVANLAEAAASAIGANALLVKVAALYHDIGKMKNPFFFIENNHSYDSPHEKLPPLQSAQIIMEHVAEGMRLAKRHGLPSVISDFIQTHHGTTRMEFFYRKHLQLHPDDTAAAALFTYQGMKPQSREQVILMLSDTVEAACRSLKQLDEATINQTVERLVAAKTEQGQLDEASISYKEIKIVIAVLQKLLKSIYHIRIEYPKAPEPAREA